MGVEKKKFYTFFHFKEKERKKTEQNKNFSSLYYYVSTAFTTFEHINNNETEIRSYGLLPTPKPSLLVLEVRNGCLRGGRAVKEIVFAGDIDLASGGTVVVRYINPTSVSSL
jgi:hypothetical protein